MTSQSASEQLSGDSDRSIYNSERLGILEAILPCLATKADLEKLKSDLTWRIILAMTFLTAIFVAVLELRGAV